MKKILIFLSIIFIAFSISKKTNATTLGLVDTNGSNLNIRQEASINSKILGKIPDNTYVEILDNKDNFFYISYNNIKGYSHKDYIKSLTSIQMVTTDNLNLRKAKSTSASIILTIPKGSILTVFNNVGSWSYVSYDGKYGYVANAYLKDSGTYLNVPSYKQYDSRWKDTKITSSKTIHQIGCLTTAMAMSESYRLNKTIYPNEMVKKLCYTTGSYLSVINTNLKNKKTTIIGVKNSTSTHFVIVYGFSGQASSLSSYKIHDPGSSTRTTLADLFKAYPTYMKIAYYS